MSCLHWFVYIVCLGIDALRRSGLAVYSYSITLFPDFPCFPCLFPYFLVCLIFSLSCFHPRIFLLTCLLFCLLSYYLRCLLISLFTVLFPCVTLPLTAWESSLLSLFTSLLAFLISLFTVTALFPSLFLCLQPYFLPYYFVYCVTLHLTAWESHLLALFACLLSSFLISMFTALFPCVTLPLTAWVWML